MAPLIPWVQGPLGSVLSLDLDEFWEDHSLPLGWTDWPHSSSFLGRWLAVHWETSVALDPRRWLSRGKPASIPGRSRKSGHERSAHNGKNRLGLLLVL